MSKSDCSNSTFLGFFIVSPTEWDRDYAPQHALDMPVQGNIDTRTDGDLYPGEPFATRDDAFRFAAEQNRKAVTSGTRSEYGSIRCWHVVGELSASDKAASGWGGMEGTSGEIELHLPYKIRLVKPTAEEIEKHGGKIEKHGSKVVVVA